MASQRTALPVPTPLLLPLLLLLLLTTWSWAAAAAAAAAAISTLNGTSTSTCIALPSTSLCAPVLAYTTVSLHPSFGCVADAERALGSAPPLWSAMNNLSSSTNCSLRLASLICQQTYRPCVDGFNGTISTPSSDYSPSLPCINGCNALPQNCPELGNATFSNVVSTLLRTMPPIYSLEQFTTCNASQWSDAASPACMLELDRLPIATPLVVQGPRCEVYQGSMCSGVLDRLVYVQAGVDQSSIEKRLSAAIVPVSLAPRSTFCREALAQLLCTSSFPACDTSVLSRTLNLSVTVSYPRFPPRDACIDAHDRCLSLLSTIPSLAAHNGVLDCNRSTVISSYTSCTTNRTTPGQPDYPASSTVVSVVPTSNNTTIYLATTTQSLATAARLNLRTSSLVHCNEPLVIPDDPSPPTLLDGSCSLPCMSIGLTKEEIEWCTLVVGILATISFVLMIFVLVSSTVFSERRKYHYLQFFAFFQWVLAFIFFFLYWLNVTNCKDNTQRWGPFENGWCTASGALLTFGTIGSLHFWLLVIWQIYASIMLARKYTAQQVQQQRRLAHLIIWPHILFCTFFPIAMGWGGGQNGLIWCYLNSAAPSSATWVFLYLPILVDGTIGLVLVAHLMFGIIQSARVTAGMTRRSTFLSLLSPFFFAMQFVMALPFLLAFRFWSSVHETSNAEHGAAFVNCLLTTNPSDAAALQACATLRPLVPSFLWYGTHFTVAGQGIWAFVLYGSQRNIIEQWTRVFRRVRARWLAYEENTGDPTVGTATATGEFKGTRTTRGTIVTTGPRGASDGTRGGSSVTGTRQRANSSLAHKAHERQGSRLDGPSVRRSGVPAADHRRVSRTVTASLASVRERGGIKLKPLASHASAHANAFGPVSAEAAEGAKDAEAEAEAEAEDAVAGSSDTLIGAPGKPLPLVAANSSSIVPGAVAEECGDDGGGGASGGGGGGGGASNGSALGSAWATTEGGVSTASRSSTRNTATRATTRSTDAAGAPSSSPVSPAVVASAPATPIAVPLTPRGLVVDSAAATIAVPRTPRGLAVDSAAAMHARGLSAGDGGGGGSSGIGGLIVALPITPLSSTRAGAKMLTSHASMSKSKRIVDTSSPGVGLRTMMLPQVELAWTPRALTPGRLLSSPSSVAGMYSGAFAGAGAGVGTVVSSSSPNSASVSPTLSMAQLPLLSPQHRHNMSNAFSGPFGMPKSSSSSSLSSMVSSSMSTLPTASSHPSLPLLAEHPFAPATASAAAMTVAAAAAAATTTTTSESAAVVEPAAVFASLLATSSASRRCESRSATVRPAAAINAVAELLASVQPMQNETVAAHAVSATNEQVEPSDDAGHANPDVLVASASSASADAAIELMPLKSTSSD